MTADDSTVLKVDQNNFLSKGQNIYYLSSSMQLLVGSRLKHPRQSVRPRISKGKDGRPAS